MASTRFRLSSMATVFSVVVALCSLVVGVAPSSATTPTPTGSGWRAEATYPLHPRPRVISCPSATRCVAVGDNTIVATADGGATWSNEAVPPGTLDLLSVSCPSVEVCMAAGYGDASSTDSTGLIVATDDGGASWSVESIPSGTNELFGISCPSVTDCTAVGNGLIIGTTDGGTTWTTESVSGGSAVTCLSTQFCAAVGANYPTSGLFLQTTDGGTTWTSVAVPGSSSLTMVSCSSTSTCLVGGRASSNVNDGALLKTTDGGSTWVSEPIPAGRPVGLDCTSASDCFLSGSNGYSPPTGQLFVTTDGGSSWFSQTVPTGAGEIDGLACSSSTDCVGVANADNVDGAKNMAFSTSNGGTSWSLGALQNDLPDRVNAVTCPSASTCFAVGQLSYQFTGGMIMVSTDAGATWTVQATPAGTGTFAGISCASTTVCTVVGTGPSGNAAELMDTTDGGSTWTTVALANTGPLTGISCPSVTECIAVGTAFAVTTTDGWATWSTDTMTSAVESLSGISCPTVTDCTAIGGGPINTGVAVTTTDGGVTWGVQTLPMGGVLAISCPSSLHCTAVGNGVIEATTDGGTMWTLQSEGVFGLTAVSCPTTTECLAVGGQSGYPGLVAATANGGANWTTQALPTTTSGLVGIDCRAPLQCVATGAGTQTSAAGGVIVGSTGLDPMFTTSALPDGLTGMPYRATVRAIGGTQPYQWWVTGWALPTGLSIDATTGVISGTPTAAASGNVTIEVSDADGATATATYPLAIYAATTADYRCSASIDGTLSSYLVPFKITGTAPSTVSVGSPVDLSGFEEVITVPKSIVNQILPYTSTVSGSVRTLDVVATHSTSSTVNAAGSGISIPPTSLQSNRPVTITVPPALATVGPWSAANPTTMVIRSGKVVARLHAGTMTVPVTCVPSPAAVLATTAVTGSI